MMPSRLGRRLRGVEGRWRARLLGLAHRNIHVAPGAWVGRGCRFFLDPAARLVLGRSSSVDDGATIAVYGNGCVELGAGSFVGHHATLAAYREVKIASGSFLAELVSVRDHDHAPGRPPSSGEMAVTSVAIGRDVWIGAKATVLRGARIGDRSVVGAHAVVRGAVRPAVLVVGVPARVVKDLDTQGRTS